MSAEASRAALSSLRASCDSDKLFKLIKDPLYVYSDSYCESASPFERSQRAPQLVLRETAH